MISRPYFIPSQDHKIYAFHHLPKSHLYQDSCIVLVPPSNEESVRSHWFNKHLGEKLAQNGFHVLRFDYFGCGDSDGDTGAGNTGIWTKNTISAAQFLLEKSGCHMVQLVGLRAGAMIACLASHQLPTLSTVLWDPIGDRGDYLNVVESLKSQYKREAQQNRLSINFELEEGCGFPINPTLRADLTRFQWEEVECQAKFTHVVNSDPKPKNHIKLPNSWKKYQVKDSGSWLSATDLRQAQFSPEVSDLLVNLCRSPHL